MQTSATQPTWWVPLTTALRRMLGQTLQLVYHSCVRPEVDLEWESGYNRNSQARATGAGRLAWVCKYELHTTLYVFAISTDINLTYIIQVSTVSLRHLDQYIKFT